MMPINNFNNTRVKIYSTSKGIKIVDSPIKIQILGMLDGKSSEADIVKGTGKSKSTISVHLRSLIDEGVINYKSHPLDRRSKLFYIVADFIGEIFPDKIIFGTPEIESGLNSKGKFYTELFRQYKSLLLYNGLSLWPLEVKVGENIGESLYKEFEYESLSELIELLVKSFEELGLGNIKVSSEDPLIIKVTDCHECSGLQYNLPICNVTLGIFKGVFSQYAGAPVTVEEVECVSNYDDSCTFTIDF